MRKILPIFITTVLLFLLASNGFAQLNFEAKSYYAHGVLTLPSGDFGDVAGTGIGGGIGLRVPYSEQLDFRGELGYIMYGGQDFGSYEWSYGMIPLTVLGEYRMQPDSPGYFLGGLGLTIVRVSWEGDDAFFGTVDESDSSTEFSLSLGGGYDVNEQFSVEGRYNIISDTSYLSVHGTYAF